MVPVGEQMTSATVHEALRQLVAEQVLNRDQADAIVRRQWSYEPVGAAGLATASSGALFEALRALVGERMVQPAQADALVRRVRALNPSLGMDGYIAAEGRAVTQAPSTTGAGRGSRRLLEALTYVGLVLLVSGVGSLVELVWPVQTGVGELLKTAILGLAFAAAGIALALPLRGQGGLDARQQLRVRAGSVLGCAAAFCVSWGIGRVVVDLGADFATGSLIALVAMVTGLFAAYRLAPTILPEFLLPLALVGLVRAVVGVLGTSDRFEQAATVGTILVGAAWAWGASRIVTHRLLAVALGLLIAVVPVYSLGNWWDTIALLAIGSAALWSYTSEPRWPWLAGVVLCTATLVFSLADGVLGGAIASLLTGVVLLASVLVAYERRARRSGEGFTPGS